jgi:hypothetical protein
MNINKERILDTYKSNSDKFNLDTEELRNSVFNSLSEFIRNEAVLRDINIELEANYGSRLFSDRNTDNSGYIISLGYNSMKNLLVFSLLVSDELLPILKLEDPNINLSNDEFKNILFKIFLTTIALHELAHIVYGHIDYNSKDKDIRKAFESEADAFSTQLMFVYLAKYEDVNNLFLGYCGDTSSDSALRLFGYVMAYYFGFLSIVSKEISDYHPTPIKRRFCSMAASEKITKLITPKWVSEEEFKKNKILVINIFIQAFHKIYPDKEYYLDMKEAAEYMSDLDKILKDSNIKSFYKIGKNR